MSLLLMSATAHTSKQIRTRLVEALRLDVVGPANDHVFTNEASLLRLVSAVLSEISDDWETERPSLNMEA